MKHFIMIGHIIELIEMKPPLGYFAAAVSTLAGLLNLLQHVQAFLGIISLIIGIAVGITTLLIQIRAWRHGKQNNKAD